MEDFRSRELHSAAQQDTGVEARDYCRLYLNCINYNLLHSVVDWLSEEQGQKQTNNHISFMQNTNMQKVVMHME